MQILRSARSKTQCFVRCCANEYWKELSQKIQTALAIGNIRRMYGGIKVALGPPQSRTIPLKSITGEVIADQGRQMNRSVGHYSKLCFKETAVTSSTLSDIEHLSVMEELDTGSTECEPS